MGKLKQTATVAMATSAMFAGSALLGGPANAVASSPEEVCGSGYRVINTESIGGISTLYLLYNGNTNCVVNWKTKYRGTASQVSAGLQVQNGGSDRDAGSFKYYAGPAKVSGAAGRCVMWEGTARDLSDNTDHGWSSPWEHCG
ncbi:hypothetical protein ABZ639_24420 [Saccharomonospora sp. NPDC006951]